MKNVANYKFEKIKNSCIQYNNIYTLLEVIQVISDKLNKDMPNFTIPTNTHKCNILLFSTISFDKLL